MHQAKKRVATTAAPRIEITRAESARLQSCTTSPGQRKLQHRLKKLHRILEDAIWESLVFDRRPGRLSDEYPCFQPAVQVK